MQQQTIEKAKPVRRQASIFPYRGKYRVQYLDTFGRERTKTVDSLRSGHLFLADIENKVATGFLNLKEREVPVFSQWLEIWLATKELELSPTTTWGYRSHIDNYLVPALGNQRLDQITTIQLASLHNQLQTELGRSPGTIKKLHSLLSGAFSMAEEQGVIASSPVTKLRTPRYVPKTKDVYSDLELEKLLKTASERPPKAHLRWLLALRYGLRQGEVLGLKKSDFDHREKLLHISRTVNSLPQKGVVELPLKSRHSARQIPLTDDVLELAKAVSTESEWLFSAPGSSMPIDASCDRRYWLKLAEDAGVRVLPLHSVRHSVASSYSKKNVNPIALQRLLGHASPAYTLATYVHLGEADLRAAIEN